MKSGLKVQIKNVVILATNIIEAHYLVEGRIHEAETVGEFAKVFGLVQEEIFGGASYQIKQKRNKSTRKPANLPDSDLVKELTDYMKTVTSKGKYEYEYPASVYVHIRDAVCARLTVYNGRRGGEPARLFIYQWKEAMDGVATILLY